MSFIEASARVVVSDQNVDVHLGKRAHVGIQARLGLAKRLTIAGGGGVRLGFAWEKAT